MSDEKLLPCWHCGGDAEVSYGVGDYDYDGGDRWRFYRAKVMCRCGSELRVENNGDEYLPMERALDFAVEAWNTRVAVTEHDFAMAVHDGNLWGRCSECKERQGYYLDAETIRNQQERIAELECERGEWQFKFCKEAGMHVSHVFQRDELIRDMWEYLTGGTEYCLTCALRDNCNQDVYGDDCGMRGVFAGSMRELGIEVEDEG